MPSAKEIRMRMKELAQLLDYQYHDLSHLAKAMYCQREEKYNDFQNDAMATLGDAVLKLVLTEHFFDRGLDKNEITDLKKLLESNAALKSMTDKTGIYHFAYNDLYFYDDAPPHQRLPYDDHDIYLEATVAAIYKDRGLDYVRDWILRFWAKHLSNFHSITGG